MKKNTKNEILYKSWNIFADNNFFSLSMRDIAKKLNIQKSLLYYYFYSKSELFYEVIDSNVKNIFTQFEIIFQSDNNANKKIQLLSELYLKKLKDKNSVIHNINPEIDKNIIKLAQDIEKKLLKYFEKIIRDGIKQGNFKSSNPKNLSIALLGYLDKITYKHIKSNRDWLDFLFK